MKQPLRRLVAGLALTIAGLTGYTVIDHLTNTPPDTGWGAPTTGAVTLDTGWGTPPGDGDGAGGLTVTLDTGWG